MYICRVLGMYGVLCFAIAARCSFAVGLWVILPRYPLRLFPRETALEKRSFSNILHPLISYITSSILYITPTSSTPAKTP